MTTLASVGERTTERARDFLGVGRVTNRALTTWLHGLPGVDQVGCEARAAGLGTRSIKTTAKAWGIDMAISMIDLTTLEGADTPGKVRSLCGKALVPDPTDPTTPRPAAVCVYGDMVPTAREALGDSGVHIAAVATAFPSGRASMPVKLTDTADAVAAGADEIDMVIDRGAFLAGDYLTVFDEIVAVTPSTRPPRWRPSSASATRASRRCRGRGARARGQGLLLARAVDVRLGDARRDRGDRPAYRRDQDPEVRRRPRLRPPDQPDDRRGPDPRRGRPGCRGCALRADGLRRARAAAERLVHGLPDALRHRGPRRDRHRPPRDPLTPEPSRHQGRRRGRGDPVGGGVRGRDRGRGRAVPITAMPISPSELFPCALTAEEPHEDHRLQLVPSRSTRSGTRCSTPRCWSRTIPGCERLETTGENAYEMTVTAGVAAIKGTYDGTCALSDLEPHESLVMRLQGAGAPGTSTPPSRSASASRRPGRPGSRTTPTRSSAAWSAASGSGCSPRCRSGWPASSSATSATAPSPAAGRAGRCRRRRRSTAPATRPAGLHRTGHGRRDLVPGRLPQGHRRRRRAGAARRGRRRLFGRRDDAADERLSVESTARDQAAAVRRREISARELLDLHLARIAERNPELNAIVSLDEERAREGAAAADEALARRRAVGPLHGLPFAFKDTHAVAGWRTTYGSPLFADHVPDADELIVERIRAAGVVLIGRTNVPEFAAGSHTFNTVFGTTLNPVDPTRSAGGSSGGAACALASGHGAAGRRLRHGRLAAQPGVVLRRRRAAARRSAGCRSGRATTSGRPRRSAGRWRATSATSRCCSR